MLCGATDNVTVVYKLKVYRRKQNFGKCLHVRQLLPIHVRLNYTCASEQQCVRYRMFPLFALTHQGTTANNRIARN